VQHGDVVKTFGLVFLLLILLLTLAIWVAAQTQIGVNGMFVMAVVLVAALLGLAFWGAALLRRRFRILRPVSSKLEQREELVLTAMTERGLRPWQIEELVYVTGLPLGHVRASLQQNMHLMQGSRVRHGYMTHPTTGLEIEVYALTRQGLREFGGLLPVRPQEERAAYVTQEEEEVMDVEVLEEELPAEVQRPFSARQRPRGRR